MSLTCFSSRRSSNENEKDIRRLNTEDIFPENIAAPNIEEDEKCEHGNKFSPKLTPVWPVSDIYIYDDEICRHTTIFVVFLPAGLPVSSSI